MYCIIVKQVLKPGARRAFLDAMLPNAEASVHDEPGCLAFDVIEERKTEDGAADVFHLYEIYESPDALAAHKETPHYKASRPAVSELVAESSVIRADVIALNPAPKSR